MPSFAAFMLAQKNSAQVEIHFYTVEMSKQKFTVLLLKSLLVLGTGFAINLPLVSILLAQTTAIEQISTSIKVFLTQLHESDIGSDQRLEIRVGYLDPRLNLPLCPHEPEIELNGSQREIGKLQVKVSCHGTQAWSKYIPAEVNVYGQVATAANSLNRGVVLEAHHIYIDEVNLATLRRSPVFDSETLIGMELKYPLTSGGAFSMDAVRSPMVIERGDIVQLVAETRNLSIRQQGEALQNGAVGSVINVRNSSSEIVVQAEVIAQGKVKVQL
ncbi:MAG: flagella basal body P-ring formation protein FlgA [Pseudohongiellaceae bacterium]